MQKPKPRVMREGKRPAKLSERAPRPKTGKQERAVDMIRRGLADSRFV